MRLRYALVAAFLACAPFAHAQQAEVRAQIERVRTTYQGGDVDATIREVQTLERMLRESRSARPATAEGGTTASAYPELTEVLRREASLKTTWALAVVHNHRDYQTLSPREAIQRLESTEPYQPAADYDFVSTHRTELGRVLNAFSLVCDEIGSYLPSYSNTLPIRLATKDGATVVLVSGIATETVYNTLRLDTRERAARAVGQCLLPRVQRVYDALKDTGIGFIGLTILYGSKDLTNDYASADGELVSLIIPMDAAAEFSTGAITEDELLERSEVYLADANSSGDVRRITVRL